jgi:hypothetical protein
MKITFKAKRIDNGEFMTSHCIIQKVICKEVKLLLNINGRWVYCDYESLTFEK